MRCSLPVQHEVGQGVGTAVRLPVAPSYPLAPLLQASDVVTCEVDDFQVRQGTNLLLRNKSSIRNGTGGRPGVGAGADTMLRRDNGLRNGPSGQSMVVDTLSFHQNLGSAGSHPSRSMHSPAQNAPMGQSWYRVPIVLTQFTRGQVSFLHTLQLPCLSFPVQFPITLPFLVFFSPSPIPASL